MGRAGVPVLCYNFMPVFDWTRTELARRLDDDSTALAYDDAALAKIDLSRGTADLPGWATAYSADQLKGLLDAYRSVDESRLWDNFAYFLERVVPVAASSGVRMALHPDDPPWSIFGLPRIITDGTALERVTSIVDDPANGITFCTGSLAANAKNDLPAIVRSLGAKGRIHFAHCRNIKRSGPRSFQETPHPSEFGDVDMRAVLGALHDTGFAGPIRSDHGRMIWGETGQPGYGLHDRALGAMYLHGLWEGITLGE
jgi:mannonate dehydratase